MNNSKRNYRITVKLNEEENKQLEFISKELGISRAEAVRELITDSSYELYYGYKRGKKNADKNLIRDKHTEVFKADDNTLTANTLGED